MPKNKNGKVVVTRPAFKIEQSTESMVLQHEFVKNKAKIQELIKRNRQINKILKKTNQKLVRSDYFEKPISLYALKLEQGFWYIGMTRNVEKRLVRHRKGKGSMWTKQYKIIEVFETRETGLNDDSKAGLLEDDMTIEYAMKYGKDNVRGGGYCQRKPRWPDVVMQNEL